MEINDISVVNIYFSSYARALKYLFTLQVQFCPKKKI